jgi:hypothetical protein
MINTTIDFATEYNKFLTLFNQLKHKIDHGFVVFDESHHIISSTHIKKNECDDGPCICYGYKHKEWQDCNIILYEAPLTWSAEQNGESLFIDYFDKYTSAASIFDGWSYIDPIHVKSLVHDDKEYNEPR